MIYIKIHHKLWQFMAKMDKSDTHKKRQIMTHKKVTKVTAFKKDAMNNLLIFIESDAN